jgi:hypothetical protein
MACVVRLGGKSEITEEAEGAWAGAIGSMSRFDRLQAWGALSFLESSVFRIESFGLGGFEIDDGAEIGIGILRAVAEMVVPGGFVAAVAVAAAGDFGV